MLAVRFGSVMAALVALAAVPGAAAEPEPWNMGTVERFAQGPSSALGGAFARLARAQAPEKRPDGVPPLNWLRYSSEQFRTLMRLLATRSARTEARRAAAMRAAEEKKAAEKKAAEEKKAGEEEKAAKAKAAEEAKRATDAKAAEEAKRAAEAKAAEEAKRAAEAKAAEETKRAAEAKAAEAKRVAEAKAAEEAKRAAEAKATEAKRVAEAKATEAKVAEEAKRAAEAKVAEAKAVEEAKRVAETKPAERLTDAKPAKRLAPCRNAGVKVTRRNRWYVVQVGDSLWSISRAHYGYGRAYRRIFAANWRRVARPSRIYPCQRIYIPRVRYGEGPLEHLRLALVPLLRRRADGDDQPEFAG